MSLFTTLTTGLQPYLLWIKILAVLALVATVFGFGYEYGSTVTKNKDNVALAALQKQYTDAQKTWDETKTKMAIDAENVLVAHDQANAAKELEDQQKIQTVTTQYQSALKEIQNAKQAALTLVDDPKPNTDDGLWVYVDTSTCTSDPDGRSLVSQASANGHFAANQQCRLSPRTADFLVEEAASSNQVVASLNSCVGQLQVATTPSAATETTTVTDSQKNPVEETTK